MTRHLMDNSLSFFLTPSNDFVWSTISHCVIRGHPNMLILPGFVSLRKQYLTKSTLPLLVRCTEYTSIGLAYETRNTNMSRCTRGNLTFIARHRDSVRDCFHDKSSW